ncbi:YfaZ precursor [Oceanospirillum multiglobuliferum]|uniref:YfaZ n=1 Tax=Oceanospirillum multiglobuliferum TaxID=64969 RepID=A0A1T4SJI9_9GAMM|nr:YfaZ family outer membrane protein [Oceanospirillum multiglobuliferum]OPX54144.1 hypothetical protein BTE48_15780 [Oceanospirillum multiglobuliferum]SKA28011.1 YfaZ precursor [Oceanospirillum multiglobuliferum]
MKRIALAAVCASMVATAQAATVDLNINNDTVRAEYDAPLPQNRLSVSVGGLYHEENSATTTLAMVGAHTQEDTATYSMGVGGKGYWLNATGSVSGLALGLGVQGSVSIPQIPQVRVGGHFYYAPRVISFGDIDGLSDLEVRGYYQLLKDADVYLGYRKLGVDVGSNSDDLESGFNVGFVMHF